MRIIDAVTMTELRSTVDQLNIKVMDIEKNVNSLMDRGDFPAKMDLVAEHIEPDTEANTAFSNSIQRHASQDQLYINGMVVPTVVNPALADLGSSSGQYLACVRHDVVGGVPTIKWATLQAAVSGAPDVYVKVSEHDTTAGYLYDEEKSTVNKLEQGTGILLERSAPGGNEKAKISVYGVQTTQIYGGDNHDILYNNEGVWEHVPFLSSISHTNAGSSDYDIIRWDTGTNAWVVGSLSGGISAGGLDKLVACNAFDTAGYLIDKLAGSTNITVSIPAGNSPVVIAATGLMSNAGDDHDWMYYDGDAPNAWAHVPFLTALSHTNPGGSPYDVIRWNAAGTQWEIAGPLEGNGWHSSTGVYFVLDSTGVKHGMTIVNGAITAIA